MEFKAGNTVEVQNQVLARDEHFFSLTGDMEVDSIVCAISTNLNHVPGDK